MIMDMQQRLYPVGRQDFAEIRTTGNFLYIDKTEYVYRMTHSDAKFIFLSRPGDSASRSSYPR